MKELTSDPAVLTSRAVSTHCRILGHIYIYIYIYMLTMYSWNNGRVLNAYSQLGWSYSLIMSEWQWYIYSASNTEWDILTSGFLSVLGTDPALLARVFDVNNPDVVHWAILGGIRYITWHRTNIMDYLTNQVTWQELVGKYYHVTAGNTERAHTHKHTQYHMHAHKHTQ